MVGRRISHKICKFFIDKRIEKRYNIPIVRLDGMPNPGGVKTVSEVHLRENETLDSALRRFKRTCAKSGVLSELRKREHYESPSVKRRKKSEAARKKKYR